MPTNHARRFKSNSFPMLLREHGESIVYYRGGVGNGLSIQAIVERDVGVPSEVGDQVVQAIIVRVLNDAQYGISALTIDDGTDEVKLPLKADGTPVRRRIARRIDDANGVVRFMVR